MEMSAMALLAAYAGLSAWMVARANTRFRHLPRLPMQWGLDRQPTWYAPRQIALTVMPILFGTGLLTGVLSVVWAPEPVPASDIRAALLLLGLGAVGLVLYALYLWLVTRWDRATSKVDR